MGGLQRHRQGPVSGVLVGWMNASASAYTSATAGCAKSVAEPGQKLIIVGRAPACLGSG
jgi:hypothetical protein